MHSAKRFFEWLYLRPYRRSKRALPTRALSAFGSCERTMQNHRHSKRVADVNPGMCQFAEWLTMDEIRNPAIGLGAS